MRVWSFSSMSTFVNCPKQYQLTYVNPVIPYQETEATIWGSSVHKALEDYVGAGIELNEKYHPYRKWGDKILSMPGEKFVEKQMALNANLEPVGFDDKSAWCRGIIDVCIIDGKRAATFDYKTGKVRPDSDQLKLFAGFVFQHYPEVEYVKTAYIWLKFDQTTVKKYTRDDLPEIWEHFMAKSERLKKAYEKDVWVPKPSGLCRGWCGAGKHCDFWSPRR